MAPLPGHRIMNGTEKKIAYFSSAKISDVFRALSSSEKGLSAKSAAERLKRGKNQITGYGHGERPV